PKTCCRGAKASASSATSTACVQPCSLSMACWSTPLLTTRGLFDWTAPKWKRTLHGFFAPSWVWSLPSLLPVLAGKQDPRGNPHEVSSDYRSRPHAFRATWRKAEEV